MKTVSANYTKLNWQERRTLREKYIAEQNNKCYWCGVSLKEEPIKDKEINAKLFPQNFMDHPIHLQHCHKTGMTEGAVHAYCNAVMWQYHQR